MKRFQIAHYRKGNSMWWINGGSLYITDTQYIVKYCARTVATMEIADTTATRLESNPIYRGVRLSSGDWYIDLYTFPKIIDAIYEALGI